ncbi:MAG: 4a-hydroxytetrahydrobiopterin dehydratase [Acidimicrobiales bacterium]|nr:4a-hydroxytetrahydrobiopterin dehydratase [Acidimicrobiales bacterium]
MTREPVLAPEVLEERIRELPAWAIVDGKLHRELAFRDFSEAFGFMARVALIAEKLDHHPDWSNSWNRVVIDIVSHAAGGVTDQCLELAMQIEALVPNRT